jgi:pSer/pThr/pTyr-binding forkhead associated (FHA) protein
MASTLFAELGLVCGRCETYNEPSAAVCAGCGDFLAGSAPVRPPPPPARPPAASAPAKLASSEKARLVVVRGPHAGSSFRLSSVPAGAGSSKGLLIFSDDPYLSPLHATFFFRDGCLFVRDEGGPSGTFVRTLGPEPLKPNDYFSAGDHLLRYVGLVAAAAHSAFLPYGAPAPRGVLFAVEEILEGASPGRACTRPAPVLSIGRSGCDLCFPDDPFLQPRHCEVVLEPSGAAAVRDLGGPEGTFVKLAAGSERPLVPGAYVRIGMQILRTEAG